MQTRLDDFQTRLNDFQTRLNAFEFKCALKSVKTRLRFFYSPFHQEGNKFYGDCPVSKENLIAIFACNIDRSLVLNLSMFFAYHNL